MAAVAKSYMRKGFLIRSERRCANIKPCMRKIWFSFLSVYHRTISYTTCTVPLDCVSAFFISDSLSRISARHSTYFTILELVFLLTGWMNLLFNFWEVLLKVLTADIFIYFYLFQTVLCGQKSCFLRVSSLQVKAMFYGLIWHICQLDYI